LQKSNGRDEARPSISKTGVFSSILELHALPACIGCAEGTAGRSCPSFPGLLQLTLRSLSLHAADLTPGPPPVLLSFSSPAGIGLPPKRTGSANSSVLTEFIPQSGSYVRPIWTHEAASFVFVLRSTGLVGTPDWVRGTVSGQVPPRCCHLNAPPAYIPIKAIGMAGSFHLAS